MAEKNSLWKNIRKKAEQNRRTGAKPKKPTAEMLRQERKIKAKQYPDGGPVGDDGLYNMQRALELGYTPDETGHWPSVDSETGAWLKSKEHPTAWMEYMYGYALNPEVQKQYQHPVVNPEGYFGENQLQYNLKADGGYVDGDKDKKLKRKPIYTSDPNDPRLQAYNDSLSLYNANNLFNQEAENILRTSRTDREYAQRMGFPGYSGVLGRHVNEINRIWRRHPNWNPISNVDPGYVIMPDGVKRHLQNVIKFQKPVQPVIYEKPRLKHADINRLKFKLSFDSPEDINIVGSPKELSPITDIKEFNPSKVLIREMGNLDRNRKKGERGLPEVYMDDGIGWRPVNFNEYQMYKEKYPGANTPGGWIRNNQKATGGYMYPDGGKTYANKQGVIMGPVQNPDGSYTLPVSNEGLPQVNLPEFEIVSTPTGYAPGQVIKERRDFKPWWNWASEKAGDVERRQDAYGKLGDLYAYYSGQPLKYNVLEYSKYKPKNAKNEDSKYIAINDLKFKQEIIDKYNEVFKNERLEDQKFLNERDVKRLNQQGKLKSTKINDSTYSVSGYTAATDDDYINAKKYNLDPLKIKGTKHVSNAIGRYFLSKGKDNKGEYISYYDVFDQGSGSGSGGGLGAALGLTKPFEIYDRIYLDSKTGKPIIKADGGPTKSLVQPPVLLDDNIIYPTDNPYMPGVNKDILDSEYDSYMRWRENLIRTEGMTPEEFFQTYPSRQEWERKNFDPANLHNGVSLAQGGYVDGDKDKNKKPKTRIYTDPEEFKIAQKNYSDSLDVYNLSLKVQKNKLNLPEIDKNTFRSLTEKNNTIDPNKWEFDKVQYEEDKKKNKVKDFKDYMYEIPDFKSGTEEESKNHYIKLRKNSPQYARNYPIEYDTPDKIVKLKNDIERHYPTYKGEVLDETWYTDIYPDGTTRHYADGQLFDINTPNIKPIDYKYYGEDKPREYNRYNLTSSSSGWYSSDEKPKFKNTSTESYVDYYIPTWVDSIYKKPEIKPILKKSISQPRPTLSQLDKLQPKQYTSYNQQPSIVGNVENISPSKINMDNFYEGQYEKYRRSPYEDPMYRVWVPGQQMQIVSKEEFEKLNDQYALKDLEQKAQGGRLYAEGGSEDEPKLLNRDGLLIAPTLPEFEISENLTDEEKFRIEKYNERLNQQKAFQEKWYPGQEYDPSNIERRAGIYADDATAKYILNNHASRNDYKNRQTYLQSFTPWQREIIARSNYAGNFEPDIGTQFRMAANKLIGRDYLGAQKMNYDSDITREDYENASRLGIFSPLMYPINAVKGIVKGEGKSALSGEIASPWVDATDMALGNEEDVWKYNTEGDIALDPLNFAGTGIGKSIAKGVGKNVEKYGKRFLRSNYNPLSIPVKNIGTRIARISDSQYRDSEQILEALKGKSSSSYFGHHGDYGDIIYGPNHRDLNKTYFKGDKTGLKKLEYDTSKDLGLKSSEDWYGKLDAYELNSEIPNNEKLDIIDFLKSMNNYQWNEADGFKTGQYVLSEGIKDLMKDYPGENLLDLGKLTGGKKIGLETFNDEQLKIVKDNLRHLFEKYGSDKIPFEIGKTNPSTKGDLYPEYKGIQLFGSPIKPIDDIAGHMGFLERNPVTGDINYTTRDVWGFNPKAYSQRYATTRIGDEIKPFEKLQIHLMDAFGKPFILHQTNPIKFKDGGHINPYMYYAGGPMYYGDGGKIWKHIGAGAYGILEGGLDTLTFGATDKLTDKGFDWLTKVGNKNLDLNDPKNAKFLRTQQQIRGYSNVAGAIGTAAFTGQWGSAIGQSAKGVNTAFQATEGLSDDFKKWSNISSQAIGIGAGLAGGSLNVESASKAGQAAANFGSQVSKYAPYANQGLGMIGGNQQSLLEQAEARQDYLNSPEYLAMKERENQAYVNQGLSFAANGGPLNNEKYLVNSQTDSMRNRYKTYKTKYRQGGSMNQSNVDFISDKAGLHQENVYNGVPLTRGEGAYANGGAALVEAGEGVIRDKQGNPSFILPDQGDGEPVYMLKPNASHTGFEKDKNGNYIQLPITVADWRKKEENRGSNLRDPKNDYISNPRKDNANQLAMYATEIQKQLKAEQAQQNQMMVEGALQYAAAGGKLNKDLEEILSNDIQSYVEADNYYAYGGYLPKDKGFNMPNSYAKGGSIHIKKSKRGTFTAAAKKHGKSVQEFARQVLANKGNYSAAMVKKANFARNAAGWKHAHGGPVVSNVNQDFDLYAQNRGGMMMARGGNFPNVDNDPLLKYENDYDQRMEDLMKFTPDISDLGNDIIDPVDSIQSKNFQQLPTNISTPGIVGNVESMPLSKDATYLSPFQRYLSNNYPEGLNKLKFLETEDEEGNMFEYGTSFKPVTNNQSENTPANQPNKGLTRLDYISMGMQALGPLSQLYYGLKGPDDVNYERIKADKIDPYRAITLANEESRRAQNTAGYNLRQNAPTSGSYMANMRALGLEAGKQRAAQTAATQYQADVANTQMQNQVNAQNAQIAMQEQIDRLQEKDAARTNVTEGLSGMGSSTANIIRDYRTNQLNQMIAKNIGTNDWRFDAVTNEIVFRRDGKEVRLPAETVTGTNAVNIGTGQMQQSQNLPFDPNFKFKRTNKYLQNPNG